MNQEVFIPVKIQTRKGRRAAIQKIGDKRISTSFSRLLTKARWLESQLQKKCGITQKEFCEVYKVSPRYVRSILSVNRLSPKIQRFIMDGYVPRNLTIQDIVNKKFPILWKEQEALFMA
jgi:hypothetical protein